jgi:hypothetical protein
MVALSNVEETLESILLVHDGTLRKSEGCLTFRRRLHKQGKTLTQHTQTSQHHVPHRSPLTDHRSSPICSPITGHRSSPLVTAHN